MTASPSPAGMMKIQLSFSQPSDPVVTPVVATAIKFVSAMATAVRRTLLSPILS